MTSPPAHASPARLATVVPRRALRRRLRNSRTGQPTSAAYRRRRRSGLIAQGKPTSDRIATSLVESPYAYDADRSMPSRSASARTASALASPCSMSPTRRPV